MQVVCLTACLQLLSQDLTLRMSPYEDTQAFILYHNLLCSLFVGKCLLGLTSSRENNYTPWKKKQIFYLGT
jgi:hypothetical protein